MVLSSNVGGPSNVSEKPKVQQQQQQQQQQLPEAVNQQTQVMQVLMFDCMGERAAGSCDTCRSALCSAIEPADDLLYDAYQGYLLAWCVCMCVCVWNTGSGATTKEARATEWAPAGGHNHAEAGGGCFYGRPQKV